MNYLLLHLIFISSIIFYYFPCAKCTTSTLFVEVSPPSRSIIVTPGSSKQLHCIVNTTMVLSTTSYKWYKKTALNNEDLLITNSSNFILSDNGTLTFNEFMTQNEGNYYCVATNSLGSVQSLSTLLEVAYIDTIASSSSEDKQFRLNQHVELTCDVPSSLPQPPTVTWYKGTNPILLDRRIGISTAGNIVFSFFKNGDIGPWECRVTNDMYPAAGTQTSSKYLLAINTTAASLPDIQNAQFLYNPVSQDVIAGDILELQCIAVGRPSPELSWYKDGIIVEENERISFNQQSRILRVTGIEQSDEGVYTCRAAQADPLPTVVSEPASIVVKDPPSITAPTTTLPISQTQNASLSVSLNCTANGSHPISWTWYRDTVEVMKSDNIVIESIVMNGISESRVSVHSVGLTDGGVWQCVASNDETGADQSTQILTVDTSPPDIQQHPKDILAFVGGNLTIPCGCAAYPYPTFQWIEDNEAITLQSRRSVDDSDPFTGSLTITSALAEDDGVYKCTCSSNGNTKSSSSGIIKIIEVPVASVKPQDTLVPVGSDTLVQCMIGTQYTVDIEITYTWKRDGSSLPLSDRITVFSNGSLYLQQFNTTTDNGYYECMVMLSSTAQQGNTLVYEVGGAFLTEDPPTRPSSPTNILVNSVTSRGATIGWTTPINNGGLQILGYVLEVRNLGRHDCSFNEPEMSVNSNGSLVSDLTIDLRPYTQYQVGVSAYNSLGYSNISNENTVFWTLEEEPSVGPVITSSIQGDHVGELLITWDHPPCEERNGRITNYTITLTTTSTSTILTTPTNVTSFTASNLRALEDYTIQISAATVAGSGPYSDPVSTKTTLASVPNVPRNVVVSFITPTSFYISWESPEPRVNEPVNEFTIVTHYIIQYDDVEVTVSYTNHTVSLVDKPEVIEITIFGVNSFGRGERAIIRVSPPSDPQPSSSVTFMNSPTLSPTVTSVPETKAFYQEIWFPAFAGGVGGGTILAAILICFLICMISYCCRRNNSKHNTSIDSRTSGSIHSLTYPHRKTTVLNKMFQIESLDSPVPPDPRDTDNTPISDSGNGQDSSSVCTMTLSQSSSTLRSKYQYRSPMEQEQYQQLSDFRKSTISTKSDGRANSSKRKKPPSMHKSGASSNPPNRRVIDLTREASPTDTVSSFEYQSQSQIAAAAQLRMQRLPSYTTDGYDTSSEDDSVFHQIHPSENTKRKPHKPVVRNSSFKVEYDSKNVPNLALMTAIPQGNGNGPSFMPTAIPLTPQLMEPPSTLTVAPVTQSHPDNPSAPPQRLNRPPKSRSNSNDKWLHLQILTAQEKSTFV